MQNYADYDRFEAAERGAPDFTPSIPDSLVYSNGLHLGKLAEPLGFDSIWTVEHHFTPYTMVADPTRLLSYFAGCTEQVNLGTMVMVLPWNDPIRAAEGISMIDNMLGGREFLVGVGRGTAKLEFEGMRIPMDETRGRFAETVEIIKLALSGERFSFDGEFFQIPDVELRPKPRSTPEQIIERLYMAWGSPESMPVAAKLGLKPLVNPQRPWLDYVYELTDYTNVRQEAGFAPARPIAATWVICAPTEDKARLLAEKHYYEYSDSALRHYRLVSTDFAHTKDYEHYARRSEILNAVDDPVKTIADMYMDTYLWGTPEMCIEKLTQMNDAMGLRETVCVMHFGTMTPEDSEASMRLFAEEVIPVARELPEAPIPGTVERELPPRGSGLDQIMASASKHMREVEGAVPG
jgi:alkanesulfonate monooxygenase SsuD/methylene tetrahydromethanopterin reductase-like flavin-dependent oxidoreductase (luciferase family)